MRRTLYATTGAGDLTTMGELERAGEAVNPEIQKLDAIAAYDRIAPVFRELSQARSAYLDAVDAEILKRVRGAKSLIDVGAGDGLRALKIADQAGIQSVVLVEPSAGMRERIPAGFEVWDAPMEALPASLRRFDAVLCLWNVLGHVPAGRRIEGLKNLSRLCSESGCIVLDVVNRYNVAECGAGAVLRRLVRDVMSASVEDVPVRWRTGTGDVSTKGHAFSAREMTQLLRDAGLSVKERVALNYGTGRRCGWTWSGSLLYILRPAKQ